MVFLVGHSIPSPLRLPLTRYRVTAGPQTPFVYSGQLVSFQTPELPEGTHTIDIIVTTANDTNLYILDYIAIIPSAGGYSSTVETSTMGPSSTSTTPTKITQATLADAIVASVIGSINSIAIVAIPVYYFLRRRAHDRLVDHFQKPSVSRVFVDERLYNPLFYGGRLEFT